MDKNANVSKIVLTFLIVSVGLCFVDSDIVKAQYPNERTVNKLVEIDMTIPGIFEGPVKLRGTAQLEWSEVIIQPDDHHLVEMQLADMKLYGNHPELGEVRISINPELASLGSSLSLDPYEDFPAESFFDVYFYMELPGPFPGDTLYNVVPLHLEAVIDQMPPYFNEYASTGPVNLMSLTTGIEMGTVNTWYDEMIPWSEPGIYTFVDKNGDVAVVDDGIVQVQTQLSGDLEIIQADFGIRPLGDTGPFTNFYTDLDGTELRRATSSPLGSGDGWSGYLNVTDYVGPEGGYFEVESEITDLFFNIWRDTVDMFLDPTTPIPEIISPEEDSIGIFEPDSTSDVNYTSADEDITNGFLLVFKIADYDRTLVAIDQYGLGTDYDNGACGPTAAASCLKYWADNGHPELEHPEGDTDRPAQSPEDTARELGESMDTDSNGTSDSDMESGIEDYLDEHGCDGWSVDREYLDDGVSSLAKIFEEFQANGEDVILLLSDTTSSGGGGGGVDTVGHAVTMGSRETSIEIGFFPPSVDIKNKIDFMDPAGGGSTADNEYETSTDSSYADGLSLGGYSLGGGGSNARIDGYIKVSPPEGEGGGSGMLAFGLSKAHPGSPSFTEGEWNEVDSRAAQGNGNIDTLSWNTTGYPPGTYLMQVVVQDAGGVQARDLRLCIIPDRTTDVDENDTPRHRSELLGNYPNPFNPMTNIKFRIDKKTKVSFTIYDIAGRVVKKLLDQELIEPGVHSIKWDGMNNEGKRVASGVYFCRMKTPNSDSVVKVIMVR